MAAETLRYLSAVLLVSRDAKRLAGFYVDKLGVPLVPEQHGETEPHWGGTLGDIHFAIHPVADFPDHGAVGVGAIKLAFTVFDLEEYCRALEHRGVKLLRGPRDVGFCKMAALEDPDGNLIELTELGDDWFSRLEARRASGGDVLSAWRGQR